MLADQQAALRRIATLVARAVAPSELFSAVAEELARCLGVTQANLVRYEADGGSILLASHDDRGSTKEVPVGRRFAYEGENVASMVLRAGRRPPKVFAGGDPHKQTHQKRFRHNEGRRDHGPEPQRRSRRAHQ